MYIIMISQTNEKKQCKQAYKQLLKLYSDLSFSDCLIFSVSSEFNLKCKEKASTFLQSRNDVIVTSYLSVSNNMLHLGDPRESPAL